MGADFIITNWFTSRNVDMGTVLTPEEFDKRIKTVVELTPASKLGDFLDNVGLNWYLQKEASTAKVIELRQAVTILLSDGYKSLHSSLTEYHRYVSHARVGEMTIWCSGGLVEGGDPWDGFSVLSATVSAPYFLEGVSDLIPWIITPSYGAKHEDTSEPYATGLITAYASSIMKHAAMTHPNPDVRVSLVQNSAVALTASELALLAQDGDADVTHAASKRITDATLTNSHEPFKK